MAALDLFLGQPKTEVTLSAVADKVGSNYWQVARLFGDPEKLYRASVSALIERIIERVMSGQIEASSVFGAIKSYVAHAAGIVQTDIYRQLLYLVIRDGCVDSWLHQAYREKVAGKFEALLIAAVAAGSAKHGGSVVLCSDASKRFLRALETALVVPNLLPSAACMPTEDPAAVVTRLSNELFGETFSLEFASQAA